MSGLVAIATFDERMEAHIFRGRLETEGIFAVVDESYSPINKRNIGVRVMVVEDDVEKALKIKRGCEAP